MKSPFPSLNQSIILCLVLTVASCPAYRFLRRKLRWSGISTFQNFPQFVVIHTAKGFSIVNEAEVDFLNFLAFSMIQRMLEYKACLSPKSRRFRGEMRTVLLAVMAVREISLSLELFQCCCISIIKSIKTACITSKKIKKNFLVLSLPHLGEALIQK